MAKPLTAEEAAALGLPPIGGAAPANALTPEQAAALGLPPLPSVQVAPSSPREATLGDYASAALHHYGQGLTSGWGDELGAAEQAWLAGNARLLPKSLAKLGDLVGVETRYSQEIPVGLDMYRQARAGNRDILDAEQKLTPKTAMGFNIAGGIMQPSPGGKAAAAEKVKGQLLKKALASAGNGAKSGALSGAIDAAGDSTADLTTLDPKEWARFGMDVAGGGAFGSLFGAAGGAGGEFLQPAFEWAGEKLRGAAARKANNILTNGAGTMKGGKVAVPEDVGLEALDAGGIRLLGTTQGTADRLNDAIERYGNETYGPMMEKFSSAGIGTRLKAIRDSLIAEGKRLFKETGDTNLRDWFLKKADDYAEVFGDRTARTARAPGGKFASPLTVEVPLKQSEGWKRAVQQEAKEGYKRLEPTPLLEAKMGGANILQTLGEDSVQRATASSADEALRKLGQDFVPVKQKYGRLRSATDLATDAANTNARKVAPPGLLSQAFDAAGQMATQSPIKGAAVLKKAIGTLVKERLPSTSAAGQYLLSKAMKAAAENPGAVGAKIAKAVQRAYTPEELSELLRDYYSTDEERRIKATGDLLRGR